MKDLDFDELDKAVNSLMGDVSKSTPEKKDDEAKTLTISPTLKDNSVPDFSKVESNAATAASSEPSADISAAPSTPMETPVSPATPPAPTPSRPPAARRGGRFMDVVHSSSNTKKPSMSVSRQGVTIEPSPRPSTTEQPAVPVIAESPAIEKASMTDTSVVPPQVSPASEWPDPLDVAGFKNDGVPDETQPLTSPFLADAKVEKRPLGGAASPVEEATEPVEEPDRAPAPGVKLDDTATKDDPNDQLPAEPEVEVPLPEELQGDLVAIESGSHAATIPPIEHEKPTEQPATSITPVQPKEEAAPSGPTSIPQQYKEEKNTGETVSGAIYDTDTYHQPLAHPATKKSGWMWVLWIVVILLVGTGGGAALFFLGVF